MTDPDKAKLDDVSARLAAMKDAVAEKKEIETEKEESALGVGVGFRIGIELVAGVLVGAGLGWFIDDKLNTKPIFMLALIAVGFAASVLSVIRVIKGLDDAVGLGRAMREKEAKLKQPPPNAWDDEDD
jgi:ATP synthase protein I